MKKGDVRQFYKKGNERVKLPIAIFTKLCLYIIKYQWILPYSLFIFPILSKSRNWEWKMWIVICIPVLMLTHAQSRRTRSSGQISNFLILKISESLIQPWWFSGLRHWYLKFKLRILLLSFQVQIPLGVTMTSWK